MIAKPPRSVRGERRERARSSCRSACGRRRRCTEPVKPCLERYPHPLDPRKVPRSCAGAQRSSATFAVGGSDRSVRSFVRGDYRSVTSRGHAGDPRGHPVRCAAATTSPPCRSPRRYRAAFVRREDRRCSKGSTSADKDPRKSLHVDEVATPELAPDEAYVAVMASSINFNTVWTSIFEPLPTFGFLDTPRHGERVGQAPRPAVPRGRHRRRRRRAARRLGGAQLEARRPGHGALQLRRRPGPVARTTTRCSPRTSASGASRRTSAASPTSRW